MLRQLFPAEFARIDRQTMTEAAPLVTIEAVESDVIDGSTDGTDGDGVEDGRYTLDDANADFGLGQPATVTPAAQPATATTATTGNNPPVAAPDPATEEVYTEPRDKFIGIVARYLEISEDAVKERVRALGYTALSGKPDERVKLYQAIRAYEPPTAAHDEPLFSLPVVDPA